MNKCLRCDSKEVIKHEKWEMQDNDFEDTITIPVIECKKCRAISYKNNGSFNYYFYPNIVEEDSSTVASWDESNKNGGKIL